MKKKNKPWTTKGIRTSIKIRDKYLDLSIKEKTKMTKQLLRNRYIYYRNNIVKLIRLSKINHYIKYFNSNIKNSKSIWKGVNEIITGKNRSQEKISLKVDGNYKRIPLK